MTLGLGLHVRAGGDDVGFEFGQVGTGAAAEEDDSLELEALDDELGDGFDGFAIEGVFDDALRV